MTTESDLLARLRALATHPAARGLADDAALLDGWVITQDSIAEGVHFRSDDPPASVGWKLAAVNLSDLAAKGAEPVAALMTMPLGDGSWEDGFLAGLAEALDRFGCALIGGDTIALPAGAPRVMTLTAIGQAGTATPARSGGRPGDALVVVGTLGDAMAGLAELGRDPDADGLLVERYRRPVPLVAAGRALAPIASAMMDVSDGLLLDLARLAGASGCAAEIALDALPLSPAFVAERSSGIDARLFAATGGDDYALLAAVPETDGGLRLSLPADATIAVVGRLTEGAGITLRFEGAPVPLPEKLGYEHRGP